MICFALMSENPARVGRKSWTIIGGALALAAVTGIAAALLHKRPIPSTSETASSLHRPPDVKPSAEVKPSPNAQPSVDPNFLVLVGIDTTPPGARVVRVADEVPLGRTPDSIELPQSKDPVLLRIELEGFIPETRWVSALEDSVLSIVLKESPNKHAPATKTLKGRK